MPPCTARLSITGLHTECGPRSLPTGALPSSFVPPPSAAAPARSRRSVTPAFVIALGLSSAMPALAALPAGADAPPIRTDAAMAGKVHTFALAEALKQGPIVLYFYPAAFTQGCTVEANLFAEATDEFAALGARVVGVSADDIETLKRFSTSACQSRFAVAADPNRAIIDAYDARLASRPSMAKRVSYVVTPDSKILFEYTSMSPDQHVAQTLQALRAWAAKQPATAGAQSRPASSGSDASPKR